MLIKSLQIAFVTTTVAGGAVLGNFSSFGPSSITMDPSKIVYQKEATIDVATDLSSDTNHDIVGSTSVEIETKKTEDFHTSTFRKQDAISGPVGAVSKSENVNSNTSEEKESVSTSKPVVPNIYYDRTTSIYKNDNKTLIRVEYYVNNKLTYYSKVEQFDVATRSYIEKIYKYNYETNTEVLIRTDVYSSGNLVKSY